LQIGNKINQFYIFAESLLQLLKMFLQKNNKVMEFFSVSMPNFLFSPLALNQLSYRHCRNVYYFSSILQIGNKTNQFNIFS
jgi:hypothetical protein